MGVHVYRDKSANLKASSLHIVNVYSFALKGNSTNVANLSVFTNLGEYCFICESSSIKLFVAPEEAAMSLSG